MHILLMQMHASKGIKLIGEHALAALIKEFEQLVDAAMEGKPVIGSIDLALLRADMKKKALRSVTLTKEKHTRALKGHICANRIKHRQYLAPDESVAVPTLSLDSLLVSLLIVVNEGRHVAIGNIVDEFLHPEMKLNADGVALLRLDGQFDDIMCQGNPEFVPMVTIENGCMVLYMELKQSIYGCIKAALLW